MIKHRRKRWTRERRAMLVGAAALGLGRKRIAELLDVSPHAVSCELSRLGLTCKAVDDGFERAYSTHHNHN
jgi:hypothetical protein